LLLAKSRVRPSGQIFFLKTTQINMERLRKHPVGAGFSINRDFSISCLSFQPIGAAATAI
jgi:hypothetical protein